MKREIIFGFLAVVLSAAMMISCGKKPHDEPTVVTVDVSAITATGAQIDIAFTGPKPSLCRFIGATSTETVLAAVPSLDNQEQLAKYFTDNGTAVSLPYSATASQLEPFSNYVTGVVCYDADMNMICVAYKDFQTLAPDNAIGDDDGAGSVNDNKW